MSNQPSRSITGSSSLFLDCLRIWAALTVLTIHTLSFLGFEKSLSVYKKVDDAAHAAVVVFFVLSGFVIAHTTSNNRGGAKYAQARLSRLYSIVLPALLITALIELIVWYVDPNLHATHSRNDSWPRYFVSALFINEIWFFSASPPINGPLWSLSFEFWYYAIFGLWIYRGSGWKSLLLPLGACLIAGPKILAMMPIWLLGSAAYRLPKPSLPTRQAWVMIFVLLLVVGACITYLPHLPNKLGTKPMYFASQFLTDWLIGLLFATILWLLPSGNDSVKSTQSVVRFRKIADITFPIYVLHYPILVLCLALFDLRLRDFTQFAELFITVLLVSGFIGFLLELQRPFWVQFFGWLITLLKSKNLKNTAPLNYTE